ncbi:chlorophyll synthase ChlG [Candidatus Viridilinea mediisalina]|uniref:Bacteriochlorophyll synthase n=1 Tax=Candidatus Viridilinea mediisalina TaxID=2024553 RepID=A0A2A6RM21_9CHLR|nr:chlorophyll synthase ChlG [Candidatus Viridilinea mediisalina]PDW03983.1 bacteriochlorophyll synthase [Candidatus Viridilinea mediisalina]
MSDMRKGSGLAPAPPAALSPLASARATLIRSLTLMKPVTWFAPAWAFLCGAVASGGLAWGIDPLGRLAIGLLMAGPILTGMSQVVNDYCDREVDAINEPNRLIPSGQVSLRHVYILTALLTTIGAAIAIFLGGQVVLFVGLGLVCALAYSIKPLRAKRNGWYGNALVAVSYEGLAWMAGHVAFGALTTQSFVIAMLYSFGAHGIMTVNDFKSMKGDARMGIRSIPVQYGKVTAARMVVTIMGLAQIAVIALLFWWGHTIAAAVVAVLLTLQSIPNVRFIRDPENNEVFFNATAIMLFVWGMLAAAIGIAA